MAVVVQAGNVKAVRLASQGNRIGPQEFISYYSYSAKGEFVHPGALARKKPAEAKYGDHI